MSVAAASRQAETVQRASGALDGFLPPQHIGPARRHQHQLVEAHGLHGARGGADVARMGRRDEDDAHTVERVHDAA